VRPAVDTGIALEQSFVDEESPQRDVVVVVGLQDGIDLGLRSLALLLESRGDVVEHETPRVT
jgi:hypothetical protein